MNKQHRLRNLAEGFLAALVECGYRGPWRWPHHQWEGSFYRAFHNWAPDSDPVFPRLRLGGSADGRTGQARDILWQIKRTSPFDGYDRAPLTTTPAGLSPREYLAEMVDGATPDEWVSPWVRPS